MRYAIATMLLATLACGGCPKPKGPKTTAIEPPVRTAGPLQPLEPPTGTEMTPGTPGEVTSAAEPAPRPRPKTKAQPPPAPPAPTPAAPGGQYVVQKGDTLWGIAVRVYGNGQRYRDIVAANPGLQPDKLKVGQKLALPQ